MFNNQIFIVDDSRIQLILLKKILEKEGYAVRSFTKGHDVINALKHNNPLLIISDIDMPIINGFQLIQKVKEEIDKTAIPFFLMSSKDNPEIRKKAADVGAYKFIHKPVRYHTFVGLIRDTFETAEIEKKSCAS